MGLDKYISFKKQTDDLFYCDIIFPFSVINSKSNKFIVHINSSFCNNDVKNSFTSTVYFDLILNDDKVSFESFDIKNVCLSKNTFDTNILKKYIDNKVDMFYVCSAEFNNDIESDIYSLINTMFSEVHINLLGDNIVINLKFKNTFSDVEIKYFNIKISSASSNYLSLINKTPTKFSFINFNPNNINEITVFMSLIFIYAMYLILRNLITMSSKNFDKSNLTFYKFRYNILKRFLK